MDSCTAHYYSTKIQDSHTCTCTHRQTNFIVLVCNWSASRIIKKQAKRPLGGSSVYHVLIIDFATPFKTVQTIRLELRSDNVTLPRTNKCPLENTPKSRWMRVGFHIHAAKKRDGIHTVTWCTYVPATQFIMHTAMFALKIKTQDVQTPLFTHNHCNKVIPQITIPKVTGVQGLTIHF